MKDLIALADALELSAAMRRARIWKGTEYGPTMRKRLARQNREMLERELKLRSKRGRMATTG